MEAARYSSLLYSDNFLYAAGNFKTTTGLLLEFFLHIIFFDTDGPSIGSAFRFK